MEADAKVRASSFDYRSGNAAVINESISTYRILIYHMSAPEGLKPKSTTSC